MPNDLKPCPELRKCPFCGGEAIIKMTAQLSLPCVYVECSECGVRTDGITISAEYCANDKVTDAWNRRATDENKC